MKRSKKLAGPLLCFLILIASVESTLAEDFDRLYFNHLKTNNSGLSHNCVYSIIQDSRGFIWMATANGLNRYDGMKFRTFMREETGVSSDYIITLCEDGRGNIWVGTDCGVTIYDVHTGRFSPFTMASDQQTTIQNKVTIIDKDIYGTIWLAVENQGLFSYDPGTNILKNYFVEEGKQTLPANISAFYFDDDNICWLALYFNNLYHADRDLKKLTPVEIGKEGQFFRDDDIVQIIESPNNSLYVASLNNGICEISPQRDKVNILISNAKSLFIPQKIILDRNNCLWISTSNGAYVYNPITRQQRNLSMNKFDPFSLSDQYVFGICIDNADGIWIGTRFGGVNYSCMFHRNFDKFFSVGGESLNNCNVRGIADDGTGQLWITTENMGLLTFNLKTRELKKYENKLITSPCQRICYDDGKIWLGSIHGIYRLDIRSGDVKVINRMDKGSNIRDDKITVIRRTTQGRLLVGTTLGMLEYNRVSECFTSFPVFDGVFVTDVVEDSHGDFWISTYTSGLIRYDPEQERIIKHYTSRSDDPNSLPGNKIVSVIKDRLGRIWATSFGGGFCLYDEQNDNFHVYNHSTLNQSLSDVCYKMIDEGEDLWIPSSRGLICFTPKTEDAKIYTTIDGLLNDEFDNHVGYISSDGTIFLGSADGFVMFNPQKFYTDTQIPDIVITDFYIGDEIVRPGDKESPLSCNIDEISSISLTAKQNSIGFGFSLLGFASPANNTILCKLEGNDTEWRKVSDDNRVFYSNLPAGKYVLQIKGVNSNGIWNEQHAAVEIYVAEKLYKSTLAVLLYILFVFATLVLCTRSLYKKAVKREQTKHEEYKRKREIELFNEKMTFFSNVVHEIKTPLTLIHTPIQNILSSSGYNETVRNDLKLIDKNTDYLSRLVNELLDFIRFERNGYTLEMQDIDLIEKMGFICFNFSEMAKSNNVRITFRHQDEKILISADESALTKILNNLFYNAVKYAESYIEIEEISDGENVIVSIKNDGHVIPEEQRDEIFKPFIQFGNDVKGFMKGVGIGLSLARTAAELHSGSLVLDNDMSCTNFILTLPVKHSSPKITAETEEILEDRVRDRQFPRLLVVEDNTDLLAYLKRKLQSDYRILITSKAERALELLKKYDIDLVITDVELGGMTGLELCKTVRADFELSHIPVIILSAHTSPKTKINAMTFGASLYIEKPFDMEYLQTCIKSLIDKKINLKTYTREKAMPEASHLYNQPYSDEEFLHRLDSIIMDNITDSEFSIEQLAEALFLSKATLNRKVKGLLDITPNDYIRNRRLVDAAQMLTSGRCRINDVCYLVGFNTPWYFTKCFKSYYGMLPSQYMKEQAGSDQSGADVSNFDPNHSNNH